MIESYAHGKLDHVSEAITLLWERSRDSFLDCHLPCNPGPEEIPVSLLSVYSSCTLTGTTAHHRLRSSFSRSILSSLIYPSHRIGDLSKPR